MNKLSFRGPYAFLKHSGFPSIFKLNINDKRGIYIWTVPFNDGELIYYVGMTASQTFSKRFAQHLKGYLSGEYGINDPVELQKGGRIRIWDGLWRGANIENFIQRHDEIFPKLLNLLTTFRIYIASLENENRFIERVEAAIAKHLYDQEGIIGNFQEPEIHYKGRREKEKPEAIKLIYPNRILGLIGTLDI